ncbi:MAG: 3D domain-containing protein [Clostridiaceae bacterium]|nr:3D domain-containing protein [Clostridiaceae bacterium]
MKEKKITAALIMAAAMTLLGGFTAFASTYSGRLDSVTNDKITGWAWDSADPSSYAVARVVIRRQNTQDIVQDTTVIASDYREDLAASGKGNGTHAFEVPVDWNQYEDGVYTIQAYIGDQEFSNSLSYNNGAAVQEAAGGSLRPLGVFKTTAYCPCSRCSEGWGRRTSTGAIATSNHTIAVDPRVIPYGSKVMINGIIYTAEDRGGGVRGHHIDIFFNSHGETTQYGTRSAEVFLVQ